MTEPTTAAGKRLLSAFDTNVWPIIYSPAKHELAMYDSPEDVILAIEAEAYAESVEATARAVAAALERVLDRVRKADARAIDTEAHDAYAAVLAILDDEAAASIPTSHQPIAPERDGEHE